MAGRRPQQASTADIDAERRLLHELVKENKTLRKQLDETNRVMWLLYKELDDKNAELERSNQELDQFATIASHDLQEPLRKVIAFGDRLKSEYGGALDDKGRDYVERVQNASRRMLDLITDLLRFARVTSQAQAFEATDLNDTVAAAVSDLEERVRRENGEVQIGRLPVVDGDPVQLRQLMQNLIDNGLKFHAPDRPPRVRVAAAAREGHSEITVSDDGIGFDPKYAQRIFEPFRRLRGSGSYEGTGMGLAICHKIVERHGGTLRATSQPGHGATFVITLPLKPPQSQSAEEKRA